MRAVILLFSLVLLAVFLVPSDGCRRRRTTPTPAPSCNRFTRLYNKKVVKAEKYKRPLASSANSRIAGILGLRHSGVVVTTCDGERWLVHKGDEYGRSSQTVVVSASYMSGAWYKVQTRSVSRSTVADYVAAGGATYSLFFDNCHHASARMMNLP